MLKDLKTSTKLLFGFACAFIVTLIIGLVGRQALLTASEHMDNVGKKRMPSVYALEMMDVGQIHVAAGVRGLANSRMMEHNVRKANYEEIASGLDRVAEGRKTYEPLIQTDEERRLWSGLQSRLDEWQHTVQNSVDIARERDALLSGGAKLDDPRISQVDNRAMDAMNVSREARVETNKLLVDLIRLNADYGKAAIAQSEASSSKNISFLLAAMLLGALATASLGILIARSIARSISALRSEATRLAEAAVSGQLATRADVMAVPAEFRGIVQGVNDTLDAVINPLNVAAEYVEKISNGNIPPKITDSYHGDFNIIKNNVNQLVNNLNLLIDDMSVMSKQHDAGDIDVKIPEEKFEGAYRVMAKGVNDMVFGHIAVKKKAMACLAEFSRGNFDAELEKFPGKKAFINENIERLRTNIKAFVHDMAHMSKEHDAGDIDIKIPEDKFEGGYRVMAKGVNDMVFGHIAVKKKAMACLAEFSRGNFDAELEKFPGKKAFINENIEQLRTNIKAFVHDMGHMSKEHDAGDIDIRIPEERFEGEYRVMAKGVNDMVFGHIAVKKKAMACISEFSRGNFDAPLERFPGKKAFINENIELLRRNSKALIADADMLVKASIEGKLSTRADASKHEGDFRKIVDGVNKTLDAVITPVMEAASALETLARYDMRARVEGDYQGDHARIKDALNGTAKALQDALIQVADSVEQVSEASQQIASSSQAVSQGASEQASSLEETSSSLEEMAGMTKQNADNTIQARSLAQTTKEAAEKGGQAMTRMTDAMEKIRAASEGTARNHQRHQRNRVPNQPFGAQRRRRSGACRRRGAWVRCRCRGGSQLGPALEGSCQEDRRPH